MGEIKTYQQILQERNLAQNTLKAILGTFRQLADYEHEQYHLDHIKHLAKEACATIPD